MAQPGEHQGRTAIITGGGRGFGKAFGHALAADGAHVVLADIDGAAGDEAAVEIRASGGQASAYACDVADEEQVAGLIEHVVKRHGGLDILINNAGLHSAAYNEPMDRSGVAKLRRLFDVNVMGVIICSLAARVAMAGRTGATIVNISSSASYGCSTAYGVSKLAVRGLTMTLAHELGGNGVRVNAIAPGLILTDTIRAELAPELVGYVQARQILKQDGEEKDVVEAMRYLCSAASRFVTGETIRVSGGFTLQVG